MTGLLQGEVQDELLAPRIGVGQGSKDANQMKGTPEVFRK